MCCLETDGQTSVSHNKLKEKYLRTTTLRVEEITNFKTLNQIFEVSLYKYKFYVSNISLLKK